jgi:hypothetical protein
MAKVPTNYFTLAYGLQADIDTDPTAWKLLEPNSIGTYGADVTTVARSPISKDRQRKKGVPTDKDSSADFEVDVTMDSAQDFVGSFVMATPANTNPIVHVQAGALWDNLEAVNSTSSFDHDTITTALDAGTLIRTRGFSTAANNAVWEVDAGSSATSTVVTSAPTDETPGNTSGAQMDVCGFRGATGDITWTYATLTIGSTTLDFTGLGLTVGQFVHLGGTASANQFSNGVLYGRVSSIATNAVVLDKCSGTLYDAAVDGTGGGSARIDILYGRFYRNVSVDSSDFSEQYITFEGTYPDLQNPSGTGDEYEYSVDNLCNTLGFTMPLTSKATLAAGFIGTDTPSPVTVRKGGAATPAAVVMDTAFSTSSDFARLRITETDETGLTTYFKSLTTTLNNNVSAEKVLNTLGAAFMNIGNFFVDIETQVIFSDSDVIAAINNNTTVTMEWLIHNDDGGIACDIPAMTMGGGGKDYPVNETILINLTAEAHKDPTLGYSVSFTLFPVLPS